jgi:hypothetical protein
MKTKMLRNTFLSVGVLFTLTWLLAAAMSSSLLLGILAPGVSAGISDGALNFSNTPLLRPQPTFITFDPVGSINTVP